MLNDTYQIRSDFRQGRRAVSISVDKFLDGFINFYHNLEKNKNPDLLHEICDPYGFALLCSDYQIQNFEPKLTCKENFKNKTGEQTNPFVGVFSFKQLIDILYIGYWFDKKLATKIYQIQGSALSIFKQIINGQGYVRNRFGYNKKKVRKYMNYALESKIALDENLFIPKPYIHHVCDGMVWPCIVTKKISPTYTIQKINLHGWGDGLFLTEGDTIIDVLKVNDLWLHDSPLENRLKFVHKVKDEKKKYAQFLKVWNWREAIQAAKILDANKTDGILVRSCHEDYLNNHWFNWNKTSYIYCYNINGQLVTSSKGRAQPDFYTLEGDLGNVNPLEEKKTERIWLDDFDVAEFQKILELKE